MGGNLAPRRWGKETKMALYRFVKDYPKKEKVSSAPWRLPGWAANLVAAVLIFTGGTLLAAAFWPIVSYQFFTSPRFGQDAQFERAVLGQGEESDLATEPIDYTKASTWFPSASPQIRASKISHYNISIPRLGIEEAVVEVGGEDLMKSLIHYGGTALPGEYGNGAIFGHSVLPQFFNPRDYRAIFSTLPTLKVGDQILVDFDGIIYRYQIEEMVEVGPDDISVLEQAYDGRYLTLITCVPPGTYLRRLVVRARLTEI